MRLASPVGFTGLACLMPIFFIKFLLCQYQKAGWSTCQDPHWTSRQDLSKQVVFFNEWKKLAGRNKCKRIGADKPAVEWSGVELKHSRKMFISMVLMTR